MSPIGIDYNGCNSCLTSTDAGYCFQYIKRNVITEEVFRACKKHGASAPATLKRECAPLLSVQDGYPKHLLSMDRFLGVDYNGIACHYLPEWLSR